MERRRLGQDGPEISVIVHVHDVDLAVPVEDTWGELQRLRDEGKVRWTGLSNPTADLVGRAHAVAPGSVSCAGARWRAAS